MSLTENFAPHEEIELDLFIEAIWRQYRYDFRGYSRGTLHRRLDRAQQRFDCDSLSRLQHHVLRDPNIFAEMLNFLTIQVSEMFRDPDYFRALREHVIPHLKTYPSLKVWIAGCANGEEFYSLAILFREEGLEDRTIYYCTDISSAALAKAEAGIFAQERLAEFSKNYQQSGGKSSLSDYYTAAYGHVVFDKSLRSKAVFAEHNLASDAVFSEVQLISSRNVLIYFDRKLQDRALALFGQSLVRGAFLGLGARETLRFSAHSDAFNDFKENQKIYRRNAQPIVENEYD